MEKTLNQQYNEVVKSTFQKYFKPLGYKKESGNFRLIQEDGLGKIVNFQRSWCNNEEECSFILNAGIYFEEGETIINQKFKEYQCRINTRPGTWWNLNPSTDILKLTTAFYSEIEKCILPFLASFPTKQTAINAVLNGDYGIEYDTAELMIQMGYGKEILPQLIGRPVYYEKLLRQFQGEVKIPIFEDKQIYRVYLVLKGNRYNNNELHAFASLRGLSPAKAKERIEADDRFLAEGDALSIKKVLLQLKGYSVGYIVEPEYPH